MFISSKNTFTDSFRITLDQLSRQHGPVTWAHKINHLSFFPNYVYFLNITTLLNMCHTYSSLSLSPSNNCFSPADVVVVQLISWVQFFVTPWTAACQTSLSFTISWNLLKLMSIELVVPSDRLILCHPLLFCLQSFPASRSFPMSQLSALGGQSTGASASASVLSMNIQGWFSLRLTSLISLLSRGLSRVFFRGTISIQHQVSILGHSAFFMVQLSHPYMTTGKSSQFPPS